MNDKGKAQDAAKVAAIMAIVERIQENALWTIEKYKDADAHARGDCYERLVFPGNLLLNEGINEAWTILCGTGGTLFDNSNAYIGVGDSNTAAAATQTGLQAAVNKAYVAMDTSYPTYGTSQKATWRATFDASTGNFAWEEITVANGNSDSSKNLNRKVQSMGTKASPGVWTVTLEITLS